MRCRALLAALRYNGQFHTLEFDSMKKEKTAWAVALLLIALLAMQLPGSIPARDEDYAFVRTLVDIHRQVATRYVEEVDADKLRKGAINGMLEVLDPFTDYIAPAEQKSFDQMLEGAFEGVGIMLNQKENGEIEVVTPVDESPALKAGVMPGDVLLAVDGTAVKDQRLEQVTKQIQGKGGSEVKLKFGRDKDEQYEVTLTRQQIIMPTVKGFTRNAGNGWMYYIDPREKVAYVRITQFTGDTFEKLKGALEPLVADGMKGLILDLRFNPGGRLDAARDVVDLFLDQGVIVSTRGRSRPEETMFAQASGTLPHFPLVVLVNGASASAAEVVAGSLMDNRRALVVGSRTYGKGSVQELIPLDQNSGELKMTVAYYYLPSGRLVHRKKDATDWGVNPQIVVNLDPETEQKIIRERYQTELFRRPGTRPTTHPTSAPAISFGSDLQLQRAYDSLMALIVLQSQGPTTMPTLPGITSKPATVEADK